MPDVGLTHIAFLVADLDASIGFYARYARMDVVHRRSDPETRSEVAWITDRTRPFVITLVGVPKSIPRSLLRLSAKLLPHFAHLGVACESREEVDRLCSQARAEGCLRSAPRDSGPPVGYWAFISDPDGNNLEVSYGQEIGLTVHHAA
jgi:catechol 2,3-dioxygenase-like lactoylglutathione lyase family enzyme